jgi:hypothetical protein
MNIHYLESARRQFQMYKALGEKAMAQISDDALNWQANEDANSITVIVKHLWGNMLSRWTDFLTTDGEKPWRERDAEFEAETMTREELMHKWEEGWQCLFKALNSIEDADLDRIVYIRNEGDTLLNAINRQISHYSYHVGQIVFIAKMLSSENWESLSIPHNKSAEYNESKFSREKTNKHFTDEWVKH